jgi:polysaccharide biosynthesis/export protein
MKNTPFLFLLPFLALLLSCTTTRNVAYFPTLRDSVITRQTEEIETPIAPNDVLTISVSGLDPDAVAMLNRGGHGNSSSASASGSSAAAGGENGYLVSKEGFILFPIIGQVKAAGLNKKELAANLSQQISARKLLLDPIISIRQANYHVTVLGEVGHPGVFAVPSEQVNILEALGMAGDATLYGKKENVLLIRQEGGKKITRRLNLATNDILTSPYFNLRSNDIVYVEPNEANAKTATGNQPVLPIVLGSISVLATLLNLIIK